MSAEEVYNRIARLRNQIQLLSITTAEIAYQILELTNMLAGLVNELNTLKARIQQLEKKEEDKK